MCIAAALDRLRAGVARLAGILARLLPPDGEASGVRSVTDYKATNYWLDYRFGFVRRGLPGEVLRRLVAGPPTYRQVEVTAVGLSRAAAISVVPMVLRVARLAPAQSARIMTAALLLLSPITEALLLRDVGRYDAIGVLVLAVLVGARSAWLRLPPTVGAVLLGGAVCLAVASEEFLLAVVAPTAVSAVGLLAHGRNLSLTGRTLLIAGALGPGAVVAAISLLIPVPRAALLTARENATRAGVAHDEAMGDALTALSRGLIENLAFFQIFDLAAVVLSLALWTGFYGITAAVLGRLLGVGTGGWYGPAVAAHAVVGAALSTVGADFRRWWGLALLGLVSTVSLLEPPAEQPVAMTALVAAGVLTLAGLASRNLAVYPGGPLRIDRAPSVRI